MLTEANILRHELRKSTFEFRSLPAVVLAALVTAFMLAPSPAWACAACYGQSDSPMAAGMNWGIFSLLAIIVSLLGCVGGFFIFLARRSAALASGAAAGSTSLAAPVDAPADNGEDNCRGGAGLELARQGLAGNRVALAGGRRKNCGQLGAPWSPSSHHRH